MAKRSKPGGSHGAPGQRQLRVGETIRRALSDVLLRGDIHDPKLAQYSITVTEVRTSPDLRHATVFFLPLGGKDEAGAEAALNANASAIRRQVTRAIELKYSPELHFVVDHSFDRMDDTNRLLNDEKVRRDLES